MKETIQPNKLENIPKSEITLTKKGNKKGLKVILIILAALLAIIIGFVIFFFAQKSKQRNKPLVYYIAAPELNIVEKGKTDDKRDTFLVIEKFPYGTPFAVKGTAIELNNKKYMKVVPFPDGTEYSLKENLKKGTFYIELNNETDLTEETNYSYYYSQVFTSKETQKFPSYVKASIIDYISGKSTDLCFTQNPDRLKHVIAYGDYDMDKSKDVAVLLESKEPNSSESALLILCYNKDLKKSYIAWEENNYYDKPIINSFKKDALIFMNSELLVKSPNNGIILEYPNYPNQKKAVLYDPKIKQFTSFSQRPKSEIDRESNSDDYYNNEAVETESGVIYEEDAD